MKIRRRLLFAVLAVSAIGIAVGFSANGWADENDPAVARMKKDISFLASDECEGRGPGTKGIDLAADYIAEQFAKAGLKPAGVKGGWFQPFTVSGGAVLKGTPSLTLKGPQGQTIYVPVNRDFQVLGSSGSGLVDAPLVFVGYGITAKGINYDDYKDLDVKDKIVVLLRHTPRWKSVELPFDGQRKAEHAELPTKQSLAELQKAAGIIVLNDSTEPGDKLMPFSYLQNAIPGSVPAINVKRSVFEPLILSATGSTLEQIEKAIDRDLKPRSEALAGWSARFQTDVTRTRTPVKNVAGVVEGSGPLAKETVVIGAHYDHLGYGGPGSRADKPGKKEIHHGADDNASGTTALIELARRFGQDKDRQGRRLVFLAFSAEEMGLLGSRHYTNKEPLFPLDDTIAMVNLDMVGRLVEEKGKGKLIVEGTGTAKGFDQMIDHLTKDGYFTISKRPGGMGPSDQASFYSKKIPVVFFFTGIHPEYHKPTDIWEKINLAGMSKVVDLAQKTTQLLASDPKRPEYVEVKGGATPMMGAGKGPRLGIIPNYDENVVGVLVGGVSDGGPAEKGGIKTGDRIVEIAGKEIKSLNNYMVIMAQQTAGSTIEVGVIREEKKLKLKVDLK